jgi:hypothetical protein
MLGFLGGLPGKLTSIIATLATQLDATMSSRASAASLTTVGTNVSTVLTRTDVATSTRMGGIKQIIRGECHISSGVNTPFSLASYSPDYTKTECRSLGVSWVNSGDGNNGGGVVLEPAQQRVRCISSCGTVSAQFEVTEYY